MNAVVIIDTSVMLNLLNIPKNNQRRENAKTEFRQFRDGGAEFLIPLATIFETSNRIKWMANGRRYECAKRLRDAVNRAAEGAGFGVGEIRFPEPSEFKGWIDRYPDCAARGKDLNDFSIIQEWYKMRELCYPRRRVKIWSYDQHLMGYDTDPAHK